MAWRWLIVALSFVASPALPFEADGLTRDAMASDVTVQLALTSLADGFFDPAAVQFRGAGSPRKANGRIGPWTEGEAVRPKTLCGFVNARNLWGAFTGFERFGYDMETGALVLWFSPLKKDDPMRVTRVRNDGGRERAGDTANWNEIRDACKDYLPHVDAPR